MPATPRHLGYRLVVVAALVSLVGATIAVAEGSGEPDPTLDGDGIVTTDSPSGNWSQVGRALARQSDGRLAVAGTHYDPGSEGGITEDLAIARYSTGGGLDTSFGSTGQVLIDLDMYDEDWGLIQQKDGKYVIVGETHDGAQADFALVRILP